MMNELSLPRYIFSYINEQNDAKVFNRALSKSINSGKIQNIGNNLLRFSSDIQKPDEFIILKEEIVLDQELVFSLTKLILSQLELSKKIPTRNGLEIGNYRERDKGSIASIINNLVCYKWFLNKDNISVLDMTADIMYRIATINHPFTNGNKRTALLSAGAFLDSIGLYLYKFDIKPDYLEKWEKFMLEIADNKNEKETIEQIKTKLLNSIWMNFNNEIILETEIEKSIVKEPEHEKIEL
ncbi:hypothetical protein LT335_00627 [Spiroplasma sp. JKS002669]|nr:hypothetical protein [Spiroplasma sp. JKS002669]